MVNVKWLNLSTDCNQDGLWGRNPQKVPMFSLTIEDDLESTHRAYIASIAHIPSMVLLFLIGALFILLKRPTITVLGFSEGKPHIIQLS